MKNGTRWQRIGTPFQITMIAAFLALQVLLEKSSGELIWLLSLAACLSFLWCFVCLYVKKARTQELITDGPFRYTRHPMYTAILVMNICDLVQAVSVWTSPLSLALEVTFIACLLAAGYCQEQETVERFGQPAVDYYKRTPRIAFTRW